MQMMIIGAMSMKVPSTSSTTLMSSSMTIGIVRDSDCIAAIVPAAPAGTPAASRTTRRSR